MKLDDDLKKSLKDVGQFSTIGLSMALSIVLGVLFGRWLDDYFGTKPYLFFLFLAFGIIAAFRNLYILNEKSKKM